jgi:DNA polymerase III delta subunit
VLFRSGAQPAELAQEIEKLCLYVKDRPRISDEDVRATVQNQRGELNFLEWDRALWRRDRTQALKLMEILRAQGQPPEALLAQLSRAFQRLLLGKALFAEKVDRQEIWGRLWIKLREPQAEFSEAVNRFTWDDLLAGLRRLRQAEWSLKTGQGAPEADITLLVCALTR